MKAQPRDFLQKLVKFIGTDKKSVYTYSSSMDNADFHDYPVR